MSVKASAWAWTVQGLPPRTMVLLLALADSANDDGACWPGVSKLARKAQIDPRDCQRRMADLMQRGLLRRSAHIREDGSQGANVYHLCLDQPGTDMATLPEGDGSGDQGEDGGGDHPGASNIQTLSEPSVEPKDLAPQETCDAAQGESSTAKTRSYGPWGLWVDAWRAAGLSPDPLPDGINTKAAKNLGKLIPKSAELRALFDAFLEDDDPWLVNQGHRLALLQGRLDKYRLELDGVNSDNTPKGGRWGDQRLA